MCKQQTDYQDYRTWLDKEWWEHLGTREEVDKLLEALDNRRIRNHQGDDKLRWGYNPSGSFMIKEAYNILINANEPPIEKKWVNFWKKNYGPNKCVQ